MPTGNLPVLVQAVLAGAILSETEVINHIVQIHSETALRSIFPTFSEAIFFQDLITAEILLLSETAFQELNIQGLTKETILTIP